MGADEPDSDVAEAEARFIADLVARGEAAWPDEHGNLPPGATHEIIEERDGRPVRVRRRRFSG